MSNFEDFLSWAKANPEGYAHCVAGLRRFIRSVEEKAGPDPIFTPRMADIELSPESLLSFSVESRMAALAVLEKYRAQFEQNKKPEDVRTQSGELIGLMYKPYKQAGLEYAIAIIASSP